MVKILEFNDLDIPNEILPKPDFDVPADLLVFMRNDPMFYRKNFFPAVEEYKQNKKNTAPLENMINNGFDQYCKKFKKMNNKEDIFNIGDVKRLVAEIISDEMKELDEGVMDFVQNIGSRIMHGAKDPFKDYMRYATKRLNYKTDKQLLSDMRRQFPKAAPADLARAITQARKAAA